MGALRTRLFPLNASTVALGLLLAVGVALRAYLMLRWRPAFVGYSDSRVYLVTVREGPYFGPFWPGGYTVFLSAVRAVTHELAAAALLQHAMGLASAVLLYGAARRLGAGGLVALVPAAVVLLGGAQIFFEHAIVSEPPWSFLVAGTLYLTARAIAAGGRERLAWAAAAGVVLALSMMVRVSSAFLVPPLAVVLLALTPGPWRARAGTLAAAAAPLLVVIAVFQVLHHDATGRWGLTTNGALNLYGRVGPWADCTKFDPPAGTEFLCDRTPLRLRKGHQAYVFQPYTPAVRHYGLTGVTPLTPEAARALRRFALAAVLGQPLTYLHAVGRELARIVDPEVAPGLQGQRHFGWGGYPELYVLLFEDDARTVAQLDLLRRDWPGTSLVRRDLDLLERLERATRPPPPLMIVVIVLALLAPLAARGERRRAATAFTLLALFMLVMPVAVAFYDWRYVVPALPYLFTAGALGAEGLVGRVASRRRRASGGPT